MWKPIGIVVALAAVGCGKGGGAGTKDVEAKIAAVNAKVPADMQAQVKFKVAKAEEGDLAVLVPESWTESKVIPGKFEPPKEPDLGFMTRYTVGSNCDGDCVDKDWEPIVDKVEFKSLSGGEVVKDEKLGDGGRILVMRSGSRTDVRLALWKKGGSKYFSCGATLEDRAAALADAFEEACRSMKVLSWK